MERKSEADKYAAVWSHDAYRQVAPGEHHVQRFVELARPRASHVVCDFGCGTGRGARDLALFHNLSVCGVDFAPNCLDSGVRESLGERFRFLQHDLTTPLNETFDYGISCDVLEHIPPKDVDKVLTNIFTAARKVYLAISTQPDVMGALIGEPLHLTVKDPFWWHEKVQSLGFRVDWSSYNDGLVCFYGSAYANAEDICDRASLNVEEETLKSNIRKNLELGLQEIVPHAIQSETVVYLLAGGPSLNDFEDQIIEFGKAGNPIVTVNGAYNWLLDRKIKPAAQVMVDAREFNKRFVTPLVDTCKYLISSQCDHEILKSLPKEQTWLWHSGNSDVTTGVVKDFYEGKVYEWYPVHGGTTIVTRALTILAMLGFRKVEVFGWDSCLKDDKHHAYEQPENDSDNVLEFRVGEKSFKCHGWMVVQANDFQKVIRSILGRIPDFDLAVHGDGLISHMINHAAGLAKE